MQITCNTSSAYHVFAALLGVWCYENSARTSWPCCDFSKTASCNSSRCGNASNGLGYSFPDSQFACCCEYSAKTKQNTKQNKDHFHHDYHHHHHHHHHHDTTTKPINYHIVMYYIVLQLPITTTPVKRARGRPRSDIPRHLRSSHKDAESRRRSKINVSRDQRIMVGSSR